MLLRCNVNVNKGVKSFIGLFFIILITLNITKPGCITYVDEEGELLLDKCLMIGYSLVLSAILAFIISITSQEKVVELSDKKNTFSFGTPNQYY